MRELLWNAPVSEVKMSDVFQALDLRPESQVLDAGCGCGEVLIRLHQRFQMQGIGIDVSPDNIREAERRAEGRVDCAKIRFHATDAGSWESEPDSLDLVVCLGSTHVFGLGGGAFANALLRMLPWVRSGGLLLVADSYLRRPAPPPYRALLGDYPSDDDTHAAHLDTGRQLGLIPLGAWTSNVDEWDQFEWSFQRILERRAKRPSPDSKLAEILERRRTWMDAYLQWGRETMGYGTYLFQKPGR